MGFSAQANTDLLGRMARWLRRARLGLRRSAPIFLSKGGNAVDAAIAAHLCWVLSIGRNLGGGGFMVIRTQTAQ